MSGAKTVQAEKCPCGAWVCQGCLSCSSDCGCAEPKIPCDCWLEDKQVCNICQGVTGDEEHPEVTPPSPQIEEIASEDNADVRLVRHVDRPVLGSEKADFVPLPITDDRNQNPDYAAWADVVEAVAAPQEIPVCPHCKRPHYNMEDSEYCRQIVQSEEETPCPKREDKQHCNCWYDGEPCCACGDGEPKPALQAELLEDAKSTDQGYDWFREQLENFKAYQGSWTLEVGDNWADSLIAHINSRQIGTRAAIAAAKGTR